MLVSVISVSSVRSLSSASEAVVGVSKASKAGCKTDLVRERGMASASVSRINECPNQVNYQS